MGHQAIKCRDATCRVFGREKHHPTARLCRFLSEAGKERGTPRPYICRSAYGLCCFSTSFTSFVTSPMSILLSLFRSKLISSPIF